MSVCLIDRLPYHHLWCLLCRMLSNTQHPTSTSLHQTPLSAMPPRMPPPPFHHGDLVTASVVAFINGFLANLAALVLGRLPLALFYSGAESLYHYLGILGAGWLAWRLFLEVIQREQRRRDHAGSEAIADHQLTGAAAVCLGFGLLGNALGEWLVGRGIAVMKYVWGQ